MNVGPLTRKLKTGMTRMKVLRTLERRTPRRGKKKMKVTLDMEKKVHHRGTADTLKTISPPLHDRTVMMAGRRRTATPRKIHSTLLVLSPPEIPWAKLFTMIKTNTKSRCFEAEEMRLVASLTLNILETLPTISMLPTKALL